MNKNSKIRLLSFVLFLLMVGLACSTFSGSTEPPPVSNPPANDQPDQPDPPDQPDQPDQPQPSNDSGSGLTTFTDENDFYSIDVPSDWTYEHFIDEENDYYYIDSFTSPDGNALVENIVYNDGTAFTSGQNGQFALYLLNNFYSHTGETGDIKVTDDRIMEDDSERLTWNSRGGDYSGMSFFEVRGADRTDFLMFTVEWADDFEEQYLETLNAVIESYRIP